MNYLPILMDTTQGLKSSIQTIIPTWTTAILQSLGLGTQFGTILNMIFHNMTEKLINDETVNTIIYGIIIIGFCWYLGNKLNLMYRISNINIFNSSKSVDDSVECIVDRQTPLEKYLLFNPQFFVSRSSWKYDNIFESDDSQITLCCDKEYHIRFTDKLEFKLIYLDDRRSRNQKIFFLKGCLNDLLRIIDNKPEK